MTAVPESDILSDAELAVAAAAGDRAAFAGIYDRYADRLHDFCIGMLRDRNAAADCVQDTFCTAATRLDSLRDPDKLRPWLYAIARNEALRCIRARRREQPSDELPEATSSEPGPDALAARSELAELVAQAAGGLSDRDRTVLELTYRHGLDGPELAEALGVSAASARTLTHRLRETVERSLGALLVVRNARAGHGCAELAASVQDWDGQFTVLTRKRVARHIDSCVTCEAARVKLVNREALLGASAVFIPAPDGLRKRTMDNIQLCSASSALTGSGAGAGRGHAASDQAHGGQESDEGRDSAGAATISAAGSSAPGLPTGEAATIDPDRRRRRGLLLLLFLLAAALFAALWVALSWRFPSDAPSSPAGVTATSSQPSPAPAATSRAPSTVASTTPLPPPPVVPPPVVRTTVPAEPPPTYLPQKPQPYVPPAPPAENPAPAPPAPSPPPAPIIEPTIVPPVVSVPVVPPPAPIEIEIPPVLGSIGGGASGGGSSGAGTSGGGRSGSGAGTSGTGTPGTSGGTTNPTGGTTNPTGGTSNPTGGPGGSTSGTGGSTSGPPR
ncbi:MAG: sigma-70 family RNA polymerase sigma factor [Mycobacterium sp.]